MSTMRIRLDSNSPAMVDVQEEGKLQLWSHKQDDALDLYLNLLIQTVGTSTINAEDWQEGNRLKSVALPTAHLDKANFYVMENSGTWKEDARLNTSSVTLMISGLERSSNLLSKKDSVFVSDLLCEAKANELDEPPSTTRLNHLVGKSYKRIALQLDLGGGSPGYLEEGKHYREADVALLNVAYPADPAKINTRGRGQVLKIVKKLADPYGIKRYEKDNYQSADFWFNDIKTDAGQNSRVKRKENFIPSIEAEWFLDLWYARSATIVHKESRKEEHLNDSVQLMNRLSAQIIGGNMIGANGKGVSEIALLESCNYIHESGTLHEAPDSTIPLNWSKTSMTSVLKEMFSLINNEGNK